MSITRFEQDYYNDVSSIEKSLKRIADALEKNNLTAEEAHNVKHAFTGMDGKQVDEAVNETLKAEEQEELDTQHDYLHGLVQDMDNDAYNEFCNTHCLPASDTVAVTNYITDLDYDEVLGIIKELEEEYPFGGKSDDQANEDAIELKHGHFSEKIGVPYDDDYDIRVTAKMYNGEIHPASDIRTKKDAILDYVTNEFGSQGARYTDIIKFAYYLNDPSASKFGYDNRGYYSCAMTHNRWKHGHLVRGGKDFFVKGINKEGNERYFAHSFVESVTDYWKFCDNTK